MAGKIDSRAEKGHAFALEKLTLEGSVRLADQKASACADHAMPGNAAPGGAGGESAAGRSRTAAKMYRPRHFSIRQDATPRNFFHQVVDGQPAHLSFCTRSSLVKQLLRRKRVLSSEAHLSD